MDKIQIINNCDHNKFYYSSDFVCYEQTYENNMNALIKIYDELSKKKITFVVICITDENKTTLNNLFIQISKITAKVLCVAKSQNLIDIAISFNADYIISSSDSYNTMIHDGLTYLKNSKILGQKILVTNTNVIIDNINNIFNKKTLLPIVGSNIAIYYENNTKYTINTPNDTIFEDFFLISTPFLKTHNFDLFRNNTVDKVFTVIKDKIFKITTPIFTINNSLDTTKKIIFQDVLPLNNIVEVIDMRKPKNPQIYLPEKVEEKELIKQVIHKLFVSKIYIINNSMNRSDLIKNIAKLNLLQNMYTIIDGNRNKIISHIAALKDASSRRLETILVIEDKLVTPNMINIMSTIKITNPWNIILIVNTRTDTKFTKMAVDDKTLQTMNVFSYCLTLKSINEFVTNLTIKNNLTTTFIGYQKTNQVMLLHCNFDQSQVSSAKQTTTISNTRQLKDITQQEGTTFAIKRINTHYNINNKLQQQIVKPQTVVTQDLIPKEDRLIVSNTQTKISQIIPNTKVIENGLISIKSISHPLTFRNHTIPLGYKQNGLTNYKKKPQGIEQQTKLTPINKIVQSLWLFDTLSLNETMCIMSYIYNGHEFHLYTYSHIDNVPSECIIHNANDILERNIELQDNDFIQLFKYKLLYEKGGYWTDMDMICINKLNFNEPYVFSSELMINTSNRSIVNSSLIKCPKKSDYALFSYNTYLNKPDNGTNQARFLTDCIKKYGLEMYIKQWTIFCPVTTSLLDDLLKPKKLKLDYKWNTIKLWDEFWTKRNFDKNKIYYGSLFCNLVNKYCKKYVSNELFNLEREYGKNNKSCVLFYWLPKDGYDDPMITEMSEYIGKKGFYNSDDFNINKDPAKADPDRIKKFIESDLYVYLFKQLLDLKIIDNLHIVFGMAANDRYIYNCDPLFSGGNFYNHNDSIYLWKLNDMRSLFSFANAKMYFYKGMGNYEHFYSMLQSISPKSIFIRYLATALPYRPNSSGQIAIDDSWIKTYASNNQYVNTISGFREYFSSDYTKYDMVYVDSIEKVNEFKKVFINTNNFVKLNKYSVMKYRETDRPYDLIFVASDVHPSKNWDVFYDFLAYCDRLKRNLSVLIITPVSSDKQLTQFTTLHNIKVTVLRNQTSEQMQTKYSESKNILITFGRDANPRAISEAISSGCYAIVLDILSDGKDVFSGNPNYGKLIKINQSQIEYVPSYRSVKCHLNNQQMDEIYKLIKTKRNHQEISEKWLSKYNANLTAQTLVENIRNIEFMKNKTILTVATEDYANNLNLLLSSLKHTNPDKQVIVYCVEWRLSLIDSFKILYPKYIFIEYQMNTYNKSDIIKLKVKLQYEFYFKYQLPFLWIDADSIVIRNLDSLFDKIRHNTLICYYRPNENPHMKFAVAVIGFGRNPDYNIQKLNDEFLQMYYEKSLTTEGHNDWFHDQTSLYETYDMYKDLIKLYKLGEHEHSINDTHNTMIYSRRLINKQSLNDMIQKHKIPIANVDFNGIEMKY